MRPGLTAVLTAVAVFGLPGCSQPQTATEATAQPAAASTATTAAPKPTAQLAPTLPPKPTLLPTATAPLLLTPTPFPEPSATPMPTPTPFPALTSTPVPTKVPAESGPGLTPTENRSTPEPKKLALKIDPAEPYSGRDTRFTLEGLDPWEKITVQFFDPTGQPADWVTEYESYLTDANENPITERRLYADAEGRASWLRIGTKDQAGVWKIQVSQDNVTTNLTYPVNQLPVDPVGSKTVGIDFRLFKGPVSNTYYTDKVPGALTVDLQNHLKSVTEDLRRLSGLEGDQTPNIYLVETLNLLKQVSESTGASLGFADGYYHGGGDDSGIYIHTDSLLTGIQRLLTHEYVHLALSETIGPTELPAWLNEGTATYYEYLINVNGGRANATKHSFYRSIGLAESAARSGQLRPLTSLESQGVWNSQTEKEQIDLQYAQSHMAVRYLADTHGNSAPIDIMKWMGTGATLSEAFVEIIGIQYSTFEQRFAERLQSREDPKRREVAEYTRSLNDIMSGKAAIGDRRSTDLASGAPPAERVATKKSLAADADSLLIQIGNLSAPPEFQPLQDDIARFMERFVTLLGLELEHLLDQEYLVFLGDVISSVDSISKVRAVDIRSGAAASQRVTTKQALVADAETLIQRLADSPPPPSLKPIHTQEIAFLNLYARFLTLELKQQQEDVYLRLLADIVSATDDISTRRSESLQGDQSPSQRVITSKGLVSDSEFLLKQMRAFSPPSRLQALQDQGTTYVDRYIQWLTLELEYAQSGDSAKLDQANAMITEINSRRSEFQMRIANEGISQPNQNKANNMLGEIGDMERLVVQAINDGFRNSATLQEANNMLAEINARERNIRTDISELEFVYNLREP